MRSRRITRGAKLSIFAAVMALALLAIGGATAEAKLIRLSGQTTLTPTAQVKSFFAGNGVTVAPTGPATATGDSFAFPIAAGFGNTKTFNGILVHSGGLRFSKAGTSMVLRRFVAVRFGRNAYILAQVPGLRGGCKKLRAPVRRFLATHRKARKRLRRAIRNYCSDGRVIVLGRLTKLKKEVSGNSASLSADIHLSRESARLVNRALGTSVPAGVLLGTATSHVTVVG